MVTYGLFVLLAIFASSTAYNSRIYERALQDVGVFHDPAASYTRSFNCGNIQHPFGCKISADCTVKTCIIKFVNLEFEFKITINKCENPLSVTVSFNVRPLNINFAHTFPASDQTIPIPGLENGIGPLRGGVFIKVKLRPENGRVHVLIQLQCGIAIGNHPIFPIVLDILKGPLPIDTSSCGGGGGGLPPPPANCADNNPLCGFLGGQCGNAQISGMCQKTCKKC